MRPKIGRPPVEVCFGTRPSQAAKSRPLQKTSPLPIPATVALEMIGPMPGTLISRTAPVVGMRELRNLGRYRLDTLIEPAPVASQALDDAHHARRQPVGHGERPRQLATQSPPALADGNAAFEQEGADLVDDAGALGDQPLAHAVEALQVELLGGLGRDVSDGRPG